MMRCCREFLSCDWGTTSFRLRWVSIPEREVLREIRDGPGSRCVFDDAVSLGDSSELGRAKVYARCLRDKLQHWKAMAEQPLPLVISGMASSSVGWKELPYAKVPFRLDGSNALVHELEWEKPSWIETTYLISGVSTECDMMRGEEMEAIGLLSDPELASWRDDCLLVLPGTHSKHLAIRDQSVVDFRTYMTGELFAVLTSHSLLKATTDLAALTPALSASARDAFLEGVLWSTKHGLARSLFRTRTRAVLDHRPADENTWFLSGVLVGAEVQEISRSTGRVLLGGSGVLGELYSLAVKLLHPEERPVLCLPPAQVERAALLGHATFLEHVRP